MPGRLPNVALGSADRGENLRLEELTTRTDTVHDARRWRSYSDEFHSVISVNAVQVELTATVDKRRITDNIQEKEQYMDDSQETNSDQECGIVVNSVHSSLTRLSPNLRWLTSLAPGVPERLAAV